MELLISAAIIGCLYFIVNFFENWKQRDINKYPSATVKRLDEHEEKIS